MRHRVKGRTLGRRLEHRTALLENLATELLRHEKITTTHAKAREAQVLAEKMITKGKRGSLNDRRMVLRVLTGDDVVRKVFGELAERYAERNGGYTRISKLLPRPGDSAAMSSLELV